MGKSESAVESEVLLRASELAIQLLRNNSGATKEINPKTLKVRMIRYGLGNMSPSINRIMKSPDYVGEIPIIVTEDMVGELISIPLYLELKKEGWHYKGKGREEAQERFLARRRLFGSVAGFASSVDDFLALIAPYRKNIDLAVQRLRGVK